MCALCVELQLPFLHCAPFHTEIYPTYRVRFSEQYIIRTGSDSKGIAVRVRRRCFLL